MTNADKKGNIRDLRRPGICLGCILSCKPKPGPVPGCDKSLQKGTFLLSIQDSLDIHMMLKKWTDPPSSVKRSTLYRLQKEEQWRRILREGRGW